MLFPYIAPTTELNKTDNIKLIVSCFEHFYLRDEGYLIDCICIVFKHCKSGGDIVKCLGTCCKFCNCLLFCGDKVVFFMTAAGDDCKCIIIEKVPALCITFRKERSIGGEQRLLPRLHNSGRIRYRKRTDHVRFP